VTVFLIPCGLSIRDGLLDKRGAPTDVEFGHHRFNRILTWAAHARNGQPDDVATSWRQEIGPLLGPDEGVDLTRWKPEVSAETNTIAHRLSSPSRLLEDRHRAVLLASDTNAGLASAMLVATHLAQGVERIAHLAVPEFPGQNEWTDEFPRGVVTVVSVKGMDATADRLRRSVAGLGRVLRVVADQARANERIEVHVTGGYKAAVLYLMTMTEVLASTRDPGLVEAWYLHEDGDQAVRIDLRRLSEEHVSRLRQALTEVHDGRPLSPDLEVFRTAGLTHGDRLTPFGAGFLAVLGERVSYVDI